MHLAEHVVPIGERLVVLAREFTGDANETYLLAHKALRILLRTDALLSNAQPTDLREAVALAAKALGIDARGKQIGVSLAALTGPQTPDLCPLS